MEYTYLQYYLIVSKIKLEKAKSLERELTDLYSKLQEILEEVPNTDWEDTFYPFIIWLGRLQIDLRDNVGKWREIQDSLEDLVEIEHLEYWTGVEQCYF